MLINVVCWNRVKPSKIVVKLGQIVLGQRWSNFNQLLKFLALYFCMKFLLATRVRKREWPIAVRTNERRIEKNVSDDDAKWRDRSLVFIQVVEGEVTCLLGFMSLHDGVVDLDNLHVWASLQKHISSCSISVNLMSILVLSKRGIQCNNYLHQMSCPKWNLAVVSQFNK